MRNPSSYTLSSYYQPKSVFSIMSIYMNIIFLLWSFSTFVFSPVAAWPTITLPSNTSFPWNYYLVHTSNTSIGSPTGVATYVSTLPPEWPAPSLRSTSTITTTTFSVTITAGTGSLSQVLLSISRSGTIVTDFFFDGTITDTTRNLMTRNDLWAMYGAAGAAYNATISARDTDGWRNVTFLLTLHPTYTWYDSSVTSWRQKRLPTLTARGTGFTATSTGGSCNILQPLPANTITNQPTLAGPAVSCFSSPSTGGRTTLSSYGGGGGGGSNYQLTSANYITFTWIDLDTNITSFSAAIRNLTITVTTFHGTIPMSLFGGSVNMVGGGTQGTGTFNLHSIGMMQPYIYPGPYTVTVTIANAFGIGTSDILSLSMYSQTTNNNIPSGFVVRNNWNVFSSFYSTSATRPGWYLNRGPTITTPTSIATTVFYIQEVNAVTSNARLTTQSTGVGSWFNFVFTDGDLGICGRVGTGDRYLVLTPTSAVNSTSGLTVTNFGSYPTPKFSTIVVAGTASPWTVNVALSGGLLDYEAFRQWKFTVNIYDECGGTWGPMSSSLTVNVVNLNDPPVLTNFALSNPVYQVYENATRGQLITSGLISPQYVSDPDIGQRLLVNIINITAINTNSSYNASDPYAIPDPIFDPPSDGFSADACGGDLSMNSLAGIVLYGVNPNYTLALSTCDTGLPSQCVTWFATIQILEANRAPMPYYDPAQLTIDENSPSNAFVTNVNGGVLAYDPNTPESPVDWRVISYSLLQNPNGVFAINSTTGDITIAIGGPNNLDFETSGSDFYELIIRVRDNAGLEEYFTAAVTVLDINEPPVFYPTSLSQTLSVTESTPRSPPTAGMLIGLPVNAFDYDADQTDTLVYSLVDRSGYFAINATSGQLSLTASGAGSNVFDFELGPRSYNITVRATDILNLSTSVNLTVVVVDVNEAPVSYNVSLSVPEGSSFGTVVGLLNTTDPEKDTLSFNLSGTDAAAFAVQGSGSFNLLVANSSLLDFERRSIMTLSYTATDAGKPEGSSEQLTSNVAYVTVTVTDVNEAPIWTNRTCTINVPENTPVSTWITRLYATDPDIGQTATLSYSFLFNTISVIQNPSATTTTTFASNPLTINNATGTVTAATVFNYEATTGLTMSTRVTDTGSLTSTMTCTVVIADVNEAPTFSQGTYTIYIPKNAGIGFLAGTMNANDPDAGDKITYSLNFDTSSISLSEFTINNATGAITTLVSHESPNTLSAGANFRLRVRATDSGGLFSITNVTIAVTEVNSPPAFASANYNRSIKENVIAGTPLIGGAVTATDADFADNSQLSYSIIGGNTGNTFAIDSASAIITTLGSINFEAVKGYDLVIQVADPGGLTGTTTIRVDVVDVNEAPTWSGANLAFTVDENSLIGTFTDPINVIASDPDAADAGKLRYTLFTTGTPFSINSTGAISVISSALNFEIKSSYSLLIGATDSNWDLLGALSTNQTITVSINNRNDAPVGFDRRVTVSENAAKALIATATATDEDFGQTLSYGFSRTDRFCWFTDFSALQGASTVYRANTSFEVPIAPATPTTTVPTHIVFRACSPTFVTVLAMKNLPPYSGTQEWYEYRFADSATNSFARRCSGSNFVCTTAITISGATSPMGLLKGANEWVNFYIDYYPNGTHIVGVRSSNVVGADRTIAYTFTDTTFTPVYLSVLTADGTGSAKVSSFCFHPNNLSATVDSYGSFVTPVTISSTAATINSGDPGFDFETVKFIGIEVSSTDVQTGAPASWLQPAPLTDYGVILVQILDVDESPWFNLQTCGTGSAAGTYVGCLTVPENSPGGTSVGSFPSALDPDTAGTPFATLSYTLSSSGNSVGSRTAFVNTNTALSVSSPTPNLNFETQPNFVLTVTVTDGGGLTAQGYVLVELSDVNEVPAIQPATLSIEENSVHGTLVGNPLRCIDPDTDGSLNAAVVYDITWAAVPGMFDINSTTGQITVAGSLDFESKNSYLVTFRCSDRLGGSGTLRSSANYTINIIDVNEPPRILPQKRDIYENATGGSVAGAALEATDPDFGATLSFEVTGGNGSTIFRINRCLGGIELIPGKSLDYETIRTYSLEITVFDDGTPALSDTAVMIISVLDADDAPHVDDQVRSVIENSGTDINVGLPVDYFEEDVFGGVVPWYTVKFSIIGGNDRGIFAINRTTGQIYIVSGGPSLLNFEDSTANRYTLTVRVTDDGGLFTNAFITINVADINEAPDWSDSTNNFIRSIDENCPRSPRVANEKVGTFIRISDQDVGQTPNLVTTIISGNSDGYFALDTSTVGRVSIAVTSLGASSLDFETRNQYILLLRLTDNGTPSLFTDKNVTINIINRNEAPYFVNGPFNRTVMENATVRTVVGAPITALDPEDSILKFTITGGNIGNVFTIDSTTGVISIADPKFLDFETLSTYTLSLLVQDQGTPEGLSAVLSATSTVVITIIDVNEPPIFTGPFLFTVPENSERSTIVGTIGLIDPDAADQGQLSLIINSQDVTVFGRQPFEIDGNGVIRVANSTLLPDLDFEGRDTFRVYLVANDTNWDGSGVKSTGVSIIVKLTNVNEAPFYSDSSYTFPVPRLVRFNSVVGWVRARDVDVPDTLTWSWNPAVSFVTYNNTVLFGLNSTTGVIFCTRKDSWSLMVYDTFNMTVTVTDLGGLSVTTVVQLYVTEASEPPLVYDQSRAVQENSAVDTLVGDVIVVTAPDPATIYSWSIIGGNVGNAFRMESSTGQIRVNATTLNFESLPVYKLLVQVSDITGGIATLNAVCTVTVNLIDVNEKPSMPNLIAFSVDENSPLNHPIGIVAGSDPDAYDLPLGRLTYSIITTGTPFGINTTSGLLFVNSPILDFESRSAYSFMIRVTDSGWDNMGQLTADGAISVSILNRNDPPILLDYTGNVRENSPDTFIRFVTASDQDANQLINYTFTRPTAVCWFRAITTTNTNWRVPIDLPATPDALTVTFRVRSTGTVKMVLERAVGQDRYEFSISQTAVSVIRCNSLSCGSALNGTVSASLLSTSLRDFYITVDRSLGTLELGTRSGTEVTAVQTPVLVRTDTVSPVVNVSILNLQGSTTDTYFTSVCFEHPSAAINNAFIIDGVTGSVMTAPSIDGGSLNFEAQQFYGAEVKAIDVPNGLFPERLNDYSVLVINVADVNEAPFYNYVSCGNGSYVSCLTIPENSPVTTIAGTLASAVDPDFLASPLQTLSYTVKAQNNQVGTSNIFIITTLSRIVSLNQAVLNFEQRPTYELTVAVTDNGVPSLSTDGIFLVTLIDVDEQPNIWDQTIAVEENSPNGTFAGSPIQATDPDTPGTLFATLRFNVTGGTGAAFFDINPTTGQVYVILDQLDFEVKNRWTLIVRVTDGGNLWKEATVTVNIIDINERPVILPQERSISEDVVPPAPAGSGLYAYDQDFGQALSFSIIGGNGSDIFRINRCAGIIELKIGHKLDFEIIQLYTLQVNVVDDGFPPLAANATMTVRVIDANDPPVVDDQARTIPENSEAGTLVGTPLVWSDPDMFGGNIPWFTLRWEIMSGNDRGVFAINATSGQIYINRGGNALLNYEDPFSNSYTLLIRATDSGIPGLSDSCNVVITVTDVNENPFFTDATMTRSIDENCPRSPRVANENVGTRILAADHDFFQTSNLIFSIVGGNDAGYFSIISSGPNYGQLQLTSIGASGLDFEVQNNFTLVINITDNGLLPSVGFAGNLSTIGEVKILVINRNEAPTINTQVRSVMENATILTNVGAVIPATDPEERVGSGLTFSLLAAGNGLGIFAINALTGQIYIANNQNLNFESQNVFTLSVQVSDTGFPEGSSAILSVTNTITINIIDVNEPPTVGTTSFSITENRPLGFLVGNILSLWNDPDTVDFPVFSIVAQPLTAGTVISTTPFAIDSTTGDITVAGINGSTTGAASDLDFEARSTYSLTVRVTDKGGLFVTNTITVTLTNVNEPPTFSTVPRLFARAQELQDVGRALSNFVFDPDTLVGSTGEILTFTFGIPSGNVFNIFALASSNGQLSVVNSSALLFPNGGPGPNYTLTVIVTDRGVNGPSMTAITNVTIETVDNNFPPTVPTYSFNISENANLGLEIGRIFGSDRNWPEGQTVSYSLAPAGININRPFPFSIVTIPNLGNGNVGVGAIQVTSDPVNVNLPLWSNLDFEAPAKAPQNGGVGFNVYLMTVTATDSHVTRLIGTGSVTVFVQDVPEDPYFSPTRVPKSGFYTLTIPENSLLGTRLTIDAVRSSNAGSANGGILARDDDANDNLPGALNYAWKTAGASPAQVAAMALFTIDPITGIVTVSAAGAARNALDFESIRNYTLTAMVTDSTGRTDEVTLTIILLDVNEPAFFVDTGVRNATGQSVNEIYFRESTNVGTTLGWVVAADVDAGDPGKLIYSLLANDESAPFTIDPNTGRLTLSSKVDYEDKDEYFPIVLVTDRSLTPLTVNMTLDIFIIDVSDATISAIRLATGEELAGRGVTVGTGTEYDITHSAMSIVVQTAGSTAVILSGTNLGFTSRKLADLGMVSTDTKIIGTYGPTAAEYLASNCLVFVANTAVLCYTVPGIGILHAWKLNLTTVTDRHTPNFAVSTPLATGYMRPNISMVYMSYAISPSDPSSNTMTTEGDSDIILEGRDFGPIGSQLTLIYGPTGVEYTSPGCVHLVPHFKISCKSAQGVGKDLKFVLQVGVSGTQRSPMFGNTLVRYATPVVLNISTVTLNTRGGETVFIYGNDFGPVGTSPVRATYSLYNEISNVRIAPSPVYVAFGCRVLPNFPHHGIQCTSIPGIGFGHRWTIEVGAQVSDPSPLNVTTSYRTPIVTKLSGQGSDLALTPGGQPVIISGDQFGPVTPADANGNILDTFVAPLARYGRTNLTDNLQGNLKFTGVNCRVTVADIQIVCLTNEGTGKELRWGVTVGGQDSGIFWNDTTNYAPPVVAFYSGKGSVDAKTSGYEEVLISGKNFGPVGSPVDLVTYGPNATEFIGLSCEVYASHVQVRCLTNVGAGAGLTWYVVIDDQGSVFPTTNYAPPEVTDLTGPASVDASMDGYEIINIIGTNFATQEHLDMVTYGPSGTEYTAINCTITIDHVQITCLTIPGIGRKLSWIVTVKGQSSVPSVKTSSYGVPVLRNVAPLNGVTDGGYIIRIDGKNLGLTVPGIRPVVRVDTGDVGAPPSQADIDAYWTAIRAGNNPINDVSKWVNELTVPKLELQDINGPNDQTITFRMPEGFGKARSLFVTVADVPSDIQTFVYDPPSIINIAPDRIGVPLGSLRIFIDGASFCRNDKCGKVLFDNVVQTPTNWSHNQILVIAPDPSATTNYVTVQIEVDGVKSNIASFSKPEPSFDALVGQGNWVDMDTRGGEPFYIAGVASISTIAEADLGVLIGGRPCTNLKKSVDQDLSANYGLSPDSPLAEQYRTYRVDCSTPPGVGRSLPIIITVPGGQSRADSVLRFNYRPPTITDVQDGADFTPFLFSYLNPVANGVTVNGVPTVGRQLRLRGSCFGNQNRVLDWTGATVRIVVGTLVYVQPAFNVTDTELYFIMPAGQGKNIELQVTVGTQTSRDPYASVGTNQDPTLVRYQTPSIELISPQRLSTIGGTPITILGSDFGNSTINDSLERGRPQVMFTFADGSSQECVLLPGYKTNHNHSRIDCTLPEGQGKFVAVTVTVAGQTSPSSIYSYALPTVYNITPNSGPTSGALRTGEKINVTIIGQDLGRSGSASVELRPVYSQEGAPVVIVPASSLYFQNHSMITFPMPEGAGSLLFVVVVVQGQDSSENPDPVTFSYDPPRIVAVSRADKKDGECNDVIDDSLIINGTVIPRIRSAGCYKTRGGYPLKLIGESFTFYPPLVLLGGRKMEILSYGHNQITALVPGGYGDYNPIVVQVMGRVSDTSNITIFRYDPPVLTSLSPNVPDAMGDDVSFRGYNFGLEETPVEIIIGGLPCTEPKWYNDQLLSCLTQIDVVGPKNLSIAVANRSAPYVWLKEEEMIILQCKRGWTGMVHEYCIECATEMRGAVCPGSELYFDKLVSQVGWWRTNVTGSYKTNCHPLRQKRDACPIFQPCEPAESCLGSNKCAEGYTGERCALCVIGKYYRVNGECIKCPDSPWAIVVMFCLGAIFALGGAYLLNAKNISLALISIGIDYFQIVAMFARTRIKWPPLVKQVFLIMSAFNFNLEIVAPECAIPEVSFSGKWLFIEGLPLLGWLFLIVIYAIQYTYKRFFTAQRGKALHSHAPSLISTGIVVLRVLYIYITRTTFDVFNCAPTNPPDGNEYMAWNLSIVCYEPGGTHLFLMPFAIVALCVYVLGAPIAAVLFLYRHRYACKYDQILRAQGMGNDAITNPLYHLFRAKWAKLYFHFIPECYYWEAVITSKKFLIAFVSLMFRQSPSYQLALALLTLFAAYVLHMRHLPYLTHASSREVVAKHKTKVAEGDPMHIRIATDMRESATKNLRKRVVTKYGWKSGYAHGGIPWTARRAQINQNLAAKYGFVMNILDYNTVDAVLLCCAILVNLAGIMFDSARFQGDMAKYYQSEYDSLAYAAIVLLFGSIIYFLFVFILDLYIVCAPEHSNKCFASFAKTSNNVAGKRIKKGLERVRKAIDSKDGGKGPGAEGDSHNPTFTSNPLLAAGSMYRAWQPDTVGGFTADELDDMNEPPSAIVWPLLRDGMKELQHKVMNLTKVNGNLEVENDDLRSQLGKASGKKSDVEGIDEVASPFAVRRARHRFEALQVDANGKSKLPKRTDAILRLRDVRARGGTRPPPPLAPTTTGSMDDDDDDEFMNNNKFSGNRPAPGTRRGEYVWDDVLGRWVRAKGVPTKQEEKKGPTEKKAGGWFSVPKVVTATGGMSWLKEAGARAILGKKDKESTVESNGTKTSSGSSNAGGTGMKNSSTSSGSKSGSDSNTASTSGGSGKAWSLPSNVKADAKQASNKVKIIVDKDANDGGSDNDNGDVAYSNPLRKSEPSSSSSPSSGSKSSWSTSLKATNASTSASASKSGWNVNRSPTTSSYSSRNVAQQQEKEKVRDPSPEPVSSSKGDTDPRRNSFDDDNDDGDNDSLYSAADGSSVKG